MDIKGQITGAITRALMQLFAGYLLAHGITDAQTTAILSTVAQIGGGIAVAGLSIALSIGEKLWLAKWVAAAQKLLGFDETGHVLDLVNQAETKTAPGAPATPANPEVTAK